jgi:hypothetical protein
MKVTQRLRDLARRQLQEENNYEPEDTVQDITFEEGVVRARLPHLEPERLAHELRLDLNDPTSWEALERMTRWCDHE